MTWNAQEEKDAIYKAALVFDDDARKSRSTTRAITIFLANLSGRLYRLISEVERQRLEIEELKKTVIK